MISKAEFLEQIKKEISKENEEVGTDTTYKRFGNLNFKFELFIVFLILLPIFREDPPLAVFLALLILGVCFFLGVFQTESPIFSFLRNADLCSNAMIDITKEEYQKKYNVPQEELDRIFKNSNRILSCETLFPKNEKGTELFRYLFNYNRKIEGLIFKMENILVPFKEDNAIFYQIEVAQQFDLLNRRGSNSFFKGWVIQVNLNSFYKDPIVFIKRRFFGGRRGLKKVELRRQDPLLPVRNSSKACRCLSDVRRRYLHGRRKWIKRM